MLNNSGKSENSEHKFRSRCDFSVRDYECDMQGIVNNGVYFNYFEHARHQLLKEAGIDFAFLAQQNINLVLVSAEIKFKKPLKSGAEFWVGSNIRRLSPVRFEFNQSLYLANSGELMAEAINQGTAVDNKGSLAKRAMNELMEMLQSSDGRKKEAI